MTRRFASSVRLGCLLCLVWLMPMGTAALPTSAPAAAGDPVAARGEVVVLASYHPRDAWSDGELAGLLDGLAEVYPDRLPAVEFLDTKRFPGAEHRALLKETLARKYRDRPTRLVIALDNPALDLLRAYPQDLFPGVPVVFAGINGFGPELLAERPGMTGVAEVQDIAGTLELGLRLHPGTRRVLVVHDYTVTGQALRREMGPALAAFRGRVAVDFVPNVPFPDLQRQLAALPPDSLVLILTYVTDAVGRVLPRDQSTRLIASATAAPVYAMHGFRLGHGIVGGRLIDGREHGAQAAALALRVLAGEDPARIPVESSRARSELDFRELRRFGIDAAAVPADAIVVNSPVSFYSQNRSLVHGVAAALGLLSLTVLVLTVAVLRARRAEERAERLGRLYRALIDTNQAIARMSDQGDLLREVCDIARRLAGFGLVWIGLTDAPRARLIPVAAAGDDAQSLLSLEIPLDSPPGQRCLAAEVLEADLAMRRDADRSDPTLKIWNPQNLALKRASIACLPLRRGGRAVGVLEIVSPDPDDFGSEVMGLLDEMAQDISYALDNLERSRTLAETLERLRESEQGYRRLVEIANEGIWAMDAEHRTTFVNRRMAQMLGYGPEEMIGQPVERYLFPEDLGEQGARLAGRRQGRSDFYERRLRRRDGSTLWTLVSATPLLDEQGSFCGSFGMVTDITERRAAEERTEAQRTLYEGILEQVREGIWVADANHRILYANAAMAGIAGVPVSEILGRQVLADVPEERLQAFAPLYRQAMESRTPLPYEIRTKTQSGQDQWQAGWLVPSMEGGDFAGMICTVRDITEERARDRELEEYRSGLEETVAERTAELRATEEHLRLILESTADGLYGVDTAGRVTFVNPAACRLLGFPAERLVGSLIHDLIHHTREDGRPCPRDDCPTAVSLREGKAVTVDNDVFWRSDGRPLPVIYSTHPMIDEGQIVGAVVSFVDIAERKRLEDRLRRLADAVKGIAGVRDLAGLATIVCSAARQLTGAEGAALALRDGELCRYIEEDARSPLWKGRSFPVDRCAAGWTLSGGEPLVVEDWIQDPRIPSELYAATFVRGLALVPIGRGEALGVIGCYWSRPHRPTAQELGLHQALADAAAVGLGNLDLYRRLTEARADAERLTQVKSVFLANMSHEIRTPMNAILGLAHLLHRTTRDPSQTAKLDKIVSAANHLLAILNDVLDFSKIEAGKLRLERCDFDLETVLARSFALVAAQAREKKLELALRLDSALTLDPNLNGDPTRLTQILVNYLGNAVKFTERGSVVLRVQELEDGPEGRMLRFAVQDTGPGIEPEAQGRLFDAFEQADPSTTRRHGGTGLGLVINRRLAQLMGGGVGVESQLGIGSVFWVTARLGHGHPAIPCRDAERLRGLRVLVADAGRQTRDSVAELLGQLGLRAEVAESEPSALETLRRAEAQGDPFAVLLLDRGWPASPELSGLSHPPALLLLAEDEVDAGSAETLTASVQAAGARGALPKPPTPSVLRGALLQALDWPGADPRNACTAEPAQRTAELALRERCRGVRLLLAEDNPINREVALELLRGAGLHTDLAADGAEALALAGRTPYDLILMDVQMPVMDGLAATRAIRTLPGYARTPILALTANVLGDDRAQCLAAGMNAHVGKPVEPEELFATLLHWLTKSEAVSSEGEGEGGGSDRSESAGVPLQPSPSSLPQAPGQLERLAAIPGLDSARALRNIGGRPDSLIRVMGLFVEGERDDMAQVRTRLDAEDPSGARRLAHSLKGLAGTLGADELAAEALALEMALREGRPRSELDPLIETTERTLKVLSAAIRKAIGPGPEEISRAQDQPRPGPDCPSAGLGD